MFICEWETPIWPPSIQIGETAGIFLASILLRDAPSSVYKISMGSTLYLTGKGFSRVHSPQSLARIYVLSTNSTCGCQDVYRNSGGIIKLQVIFTTRGVELKICITHAQACFLPCAQSKSTFRFYKYWMRL